MAYISDKMGLRVWDQLNDPYDHDQLADNWNKISYHDHTPGRGVQIPTEGLADGAVTAAKLAAGVTLNVADNAVTNAKLADNAVGTAELIDGSVTGAKIADATITAVDLDPTYLSKVGVSSGATTRRGKSIITTGGGTGLGDSTINTASVGTGYVTMASATSGLVAADQVTGVVLPTDGLIAVAYQAVWQESVLDTARAAIFVGGTQLKVAGNNAITPQTSEAYVAGSAISLDYPLISGPMGLGTGKAGAGGYAEVTTGQAVGYAATAGGGAVAMVIGGGASSIAAPMALGGPCLIFANAGTYDISIKFKASSGSVTVKNRKLWVWTIGF